MSTNARNARKSHRRESQARAATKRRRSAPPSRPDGITIAEYLLAPRLTAIAEADETHAVIKLSCNLHLRYTDGGGWLLALGEKEAPSAPIDPEIAKAMIAAEIMRPVVASAPAAEQLANNVMTRFALNLHGELIPALRRLEASTLEAHEAWRRAHEERKRAASVKQAVLAQQAANNATRRES